MEEETENETKAAIEIELKEREKGGGREGGSERDKENNQKTGGKNDRLYSVSIKERQAFSLERIIK